MANIFIGTPIHSDASATITPVLSGGSWVAALPLSNLQDPRLSKVARSTDATRYSTQFRVDLQTDRKIRLIALPAHNLSTAARVRSRAYSVLPCFNSPVVGDSTWSVSGTPTRVAASFVCSDGVPLDLIADDNGGAAEYPFKAVVFTGDAVKVVRLRVRKPGTVAASGWDIFIVDTVAAANRLAFRLVWTGDTPTVSLSTTGTLAATVANGDSFDLIFVTTSVTAANAHNIQVRPAGVSGETGELLVGDVTIFDSVSSPLLYDSGLDLVWPASVTTSIAGDTPVPHMHVVPIAFVVAARYWLLEISDELNTDGYVELGRLVLADGYEPVMNYKLGAGLVWQSLALKDEAENGTVHVVHRPQRRVLKAVLDNQALDGLLAQGHEFARVAEAGKQVFVSMDYANTAAWRQSFLATALRGVGPIDFHVYAEGSMPVTLTEVL